MRKSMTVRGAASVRHRVDSMGDGASKANQDASKEAYKANGGFSAEHNVAPYTNQDVSPEYQKRIRVCTPIINLKGCP